MSHEQNPDQCLILYLFSYRRSNPQLLWEFLFLLKVPSQPVTDQQRLSPVAVTAMATAPAAQQQQSFFFGPERGPAHPPATEASLKGVFCLPITHTRLQHAPVLGLLPLPNPGSQNRTDKERTEERKKNPAVGHCNTRLPRTALVVGRHAGATHSPPVATAAKKEGEAANPDEVKGRTGKTGVSSFE